MGRSIQRTYVGAYIKVEINTDHELEIFNEIIDDVEYDYFKNYFQFPYQGLEGKGILIPNNNKLYSYEIPIYEEAIIYYEFLYFTRYISNFKDQYSEVISKLNKLFPQRVNIHSGVLVYNDED